MSRGHVSLKNLLLPNRRLSASLPTAPLFQRIDMALDKALVYLIACNAG